MNSGWIKGVLIGVAVLGLLAALRYRPWEQKAHTNRPTLRVGFLPVT